MNGFKSVDLCKQIRNSWIKLAELYLNKKKPPLRFWLTTFSSCLLKSDKYVLRVARLTDCEWFGTQRFCLLLFFAAFLCVVSIFRFLLVYKYKCRNSQLLCFTLKSFQHVERLNNQCVCVCVCSCAHRWGPNQMPHSCPFMCVYMQGRMYAPLCIGSLRPSLRHWCPFLRHRQAPPTRAGHAHFLCISIKAAVDSGRHGHCGSPNQRLYTLLSKYCR